MFCIARNDNYYSSNLTLLNTTTSIRQWYSVGGSNSTEREARNRTPSECEAALGATAITASSALFEIPGQGDKQQTFPRQPFRFFFKLCCF